MIIFNTAFAQKAFNKVIVKETQLTEGTKLNRIACENIFNWGYHDNDMYRIVEISFCKNDIDADGNAKEFFWQEFYIPHDEYGMYDKTLAISNEHRKKGIHGVFFNHGTSDKPDWATHT